MYKSRKRDEVKQSVRSLKSTTQSSNMDDTDTVCPLCKTFYAEGEDWIACNLCEAWYDRRCLQLDDSQWEDLEGNDWYCLACLK